MSATYFMFPSVFSIYYGQLHNRPIQTREMKLLFTENAVMLRLLAYAQGSGRSGVEMCEWRREKENVP
jgi:hypothetical protein